MREFPLLDAVLRRRHIFLVVLAIFMYVGSARHLPGDNDWQFFTWGSDLLFGKHYAFVRSTDYIEASRPGGLHLYANYPFLQIGPPPILLAKVLHIGPREGLYVAQAVVQLLGLVAVGCLDRAYGDGSRRHALSVLVGGSLVTVVWVGLTHTTHLDDAMTLAAMSGACWGLRSGRLLLAGSLLGLAAASKPWGVVLLSLALVPDTWRARIRAGAAAVAVGGLAWTPFVLADPQTLKVGGVQLIVLPGSVLSLYGPPQYIAHPSFLRLSQLAAGLLVGIAIVLLTRRWAVVPLAAFCIRLLIDPGPYQYYATGVLLAALLVDVAVLRKRLPYLTCMVGVSWLLVEVVKTDEQAAAVRLIAYAAALIVALLAALQGRRHRHRLVPEAALP